MRVRPWLVMLLSVSLGCGRTQVLRYATDGGELSDDQSSDAGHVGCTDGTLALRKAVPKVMFVLDRSGSMSAFFGSGRSTRWSSLTSALARVLPPVDSSMEIGALVFPSGTNDSCSVAGAPNLDPATGQVDALVSLMQNSRPSGHTPTADAVINAGAYLLGSHAASSARAMVLATDGSPNCNAALNPTTCVCIEGPRCTQSTMCLDDTRTVNVIRSMASQNLPTYVIGIQDSSTVAIGVLNEMARAGGRARSGTQAYYAVTSQAGLESALTTIRNQVGSCVFLSASVPPDDGAIEISVDGVSIPADPLEGWAWSNRDNGELVLTGAACAQILENSVVEAHVRCERADAGTDGGADAGRDGG